MRVDPKKLKAEKVAALRASLETLPIIQDWWRYDILPGTVKSKQAAQWADYYRRVKASKAYQVYKRQQELVTKLSHVRKWVVDELGKPVLTDSWKEIRAEVQAVQDEAKRLLKTGWDEDFGRPTFRDPFEFTNSPEVAQYKILINWEEQNTEKKAFDYLT